MTDDRIFNGYDAVRAARIPKHLVAIPSSSYGWRTQDESKSARHFAELAALIGGYDEWATIGGRGHMPWFPAVYVPRVEALVWSGDGFGKIGARLCCKSSPAGPCEAIVHTDAWHSSLCGRPAVPGEIIKEMGGEVPGCSMHVSAQRKSREAQARWHAEWDARSAADDRRGEISRASADWAERLRSELGVDAHGMSPDGEHLLVAVQPETLYRQLVDLLGVLRDVGIEDHPFQPKET